MIPQNARGLDLRHAAMHGQQSGARKADLPTLIVRGRLDGEIAFAVGAHGPVVDIGGTDAEQTIVDDHDLAVDHYVDGLPTLADLRIDEANAPTDAGISDNRLEADAAMA